MDSLQNLLGKFDSKEPQEVTALKRYITETFQSPSQIALRGETVVITVPSASLANTLRLRTTELQKTANTDKRLIFRIGQ